LDISPNTWETNGKVNKQDNFKLKSFCTEKGETNRMKNAAQELVGNICKVFFFLTTITHIDNCQSVKSLEAWCSQLMFSTNL
jgi:hypothetical protein